MLFLNNLPDDLAIIEIHQAIGNLVIRFPLLHCQECAKTLKQWLKQRKMAFITVLKFLAKFSTTFPDKDYTQMTGFKTLPLYLMSLK